MQPVCPPARSHAQLPHHEARSHRGTPSARNVAGLPGQQQCCNALLHQRTRTLPALQGLDTATPQIVLEGGVQLQGAYEENLGTLMLFEHRSGQQDGAGWCCAPVHGEAPGWP